MSEFIIGRRQLYILPTRIGWYFSVILIALFAIAVKYDNQAAFMMLFLLVSIGLIGMHYTHNNVVGLTLDTHYTKSVFVGENANFPIKISNPSNRHRHAVWLICGGHQRVFDIESNSNKKLSIDLPTLNRGYFNCPNVTLSSQYPLGLFFCWSKRFETKQQCIVYPQPLDLIAFPDSDENTSQKQSKANTTNSNADFSGMKAYQPGDRPRDIHWPSLAKTHKLVTIQHEDQTSSSVNLSWFSLPVNLSTEDRLSQLCFWVIDAEKNASPYQLEMPNHTIEFNSGINHFNECLTVLALWGQQ